MKTLILLAGYPGTGKLICVIKSQKNTIFSVVFLKMI